MRNSKIQSTALKIVAIILILLTVFPLLVSCKARPLAQTKLAKTEVGTVGEYKVLYEELYFLANNYARAMKDDYGNDKAALDAAVWAKVKENIVSNYAILELCKSAGLVYDEEALKEDVEKAIELQIEQDYGGSRSDYLKSQKEVGLTDHYVRFVTGVDILYNRLDTQYKTTGIVPNSDEALLKFIKENFIHTWHIAIFVNEGDDRDAKLKKAQEALALIESGTSMYDMIGGVYNEDLNPGSLKDAFGYYFPKGIMEKSYEDAAFSLNVGKHSQIVESMGENNYGEYVECFYIIERLPLSDEEIKSNFFTLSDMVSESIIAQQVEAIKATLTFTPNEFANSLDISNLKPAKNGADTLLIIVVSACVAVCVGAVALIIIVRNVKTKKFHKQNKK